MSVSFPNLLLLVKEQKERDLLDWKHELPTEGQQ